MELINAEHFRWAKNHMAKRGSDETVPHVIPPNFSDSTKKFHQQIPGYSISPLKKLEQLSRFLGVGAIWVKDESERLTLNSFKSLGGSFAIYQFIKKKLEIDRDISFEELISDEVRNKLGNITFVSATDGNHGRGLAWAALKLKQKAIIYVHQHTTIARIKAIEEFGAKVVVVNGTSMLWSAIREQVCTLTARMPAGQLMLPTVNFLDLKRKRDDNSGNEARNKKAKATARRKRAAPSEP